MVKAIIYFKTLLHLAIFHAILLRRKLHQKLPSVSDQDSKLSCHFLLQQALQKVKFDSTFRNDRGNDFIDSFNICAVQHPVQLFLQCLARSAKRNPPYYPLLGPPRQSHCTM